MNRKIATIKKLWLGIAVLALLSPLGILLPMKFKAGSAWGEWSADEIGKMLGFVPGGMKRLTSIWQAPLSDYTVKGLENSGPVVQSLAYIVSAVAGIAVIVAVVMLLGKITTKDE